MTLLSHEQRAHAIIIGLDSLQGLNSARILAARDIPVIGMAKDANSPYCGTNVCENIFLVDTAGDELIATLLALGPQFSQRPVLYPCQDKNVLVVSRSREALKEWYHVILPPQEVVELMIDKIAFYNYAKAAGFPVPETYVLHSRADAEEAAINLTFPCVLKPPWRPETWTRHTRVKALLADSAETLLAQYDHYHKWGDLFIVQEYIEGPDRNHYTCNCYLDRHSRSLVTFVTRKLRQWPPRTGQACLAEECRNDVVAEEALRLFQSVPYHGLGYLEMKLEHRTGKYLIVEPNVGRPTGRAIMAEAGGVELLYTMYCDALGLPLPESRTQTYQGPKWMHELRDPEAALCQWWHGELSLEEWWRSVRGTRSFALLSRHDPGPFVAALRRAVPVFLSPKERGRDDYRGRRLTRFERVRVKN